MPDQTNPLIKDLESELAKLLEEMKKEADKTGENYKKLNERLTALWKLKEVETTAAIKREELRHKQEELRSKEAQETREHKLKTDQSEADAKQKDREHDLKAEELKQKQQDLDNFSRVSAGTIVTAAVNLAGLLAILNHERAAVITSKAFGFVGKLTK